MTDKEITEETNCDGRTVKIDTGFYTVEVYGDPDDDLEAVQQTAEELADRAKADLFELDGKGPGYD